MGKYTNIFEFLHPGCTSYTWVKDDRSGKRQRKASRIDHILVSPSLTKFCQGVKHKYTGSLSDHNAVILTLDWCKTPKGPGIFRAGVGIQNDPIYKEAISQIIKYSIASYISDEQTKNSILELLNSKKETVDLIHELETGSQNDEDKKAALLEAQYKLKIINMTMPTNNSILSHIEDHRKPSLLEYVLHKMKRFTQTYSKKKFAERLLEREKLDHVMENLLKNPNYDKETYEVLKKQAQEMEDEDL